MSTSTNPRWWMTRAERLAAAVIELVIEVHGHAVALGRLQDARWGRALGAAVGLGQSPDLREVARLLQRGLDRRDQARLSLRIDDEARLPDGRSAPLFGVDGERVVTFARRRAAIDIERRLGAAQLIAHSSASAALGFGHRTPGRGAREVTALCLLAELVVDPAPEPSLLFLTLGSLDVSSGIPVSVFDRVLQDLESMLHRGPAASSRATSVLWLHDELLRHESRAPRYAIDRFLAREHRFGFDLLARTRSDVRPLPRPPRRPARRSFRDLDWTPPVFEVPDRPLDLFAP